MWRIRAARPAPKPLVVPVAAALVPVGRDTQLGPLGPLGSTGSQVIGNVGGEHGPRTVRTAPWRRPQPGKSAQEWSR